LAFKLVASGKGNYSFEWMGSDLQAPSLSIGMSLRSRFNSRRNSGAKNYLEGGRVPAIKSIYRGYIS
jgi:hypothetical protein